MFKPAKLENINLRNPEKRGWLRLTFKFGGIIELLVIVGVWALLFAQRAEVLGFTRERILAYILFGSLIGTISGHLIQRIVIRDLGSGRGRDLLYRPVAYLGNIFVNGFGRNLLPFILSVAIHIGLLYFFIDEIRPNTDPRYLSVIITMIFMAFLNELLIVHLLRVFTFWPVDSAESYNNALRLKKLLAGNYFPLAILPAVLYQASFILPFAYSFYVPTELYLKRISLADGWRGVGVQCIWAVLLYLAVKIVRTRKNFAEKMKTEEMKIDGG